MIRKNEKMAFLQKINKETETSIREKCRLYGYNKLKSDIAVKFFIENATPKEVWLWLLSTKQSNIEWDSVKIIKYRMKKELFQDIKDKD